ncbi:MAG: hypothetical protein R6V03_02280 [Kiritimatiellia bacterium]
MQKLRNHSLVATTASLAAVLFAFCFLSALCFAQDSDEEAMVLEEMKVDEMVEGAGLGSETAEEDETETEAAADEDILGELGDLLGSDVLEEAEKEAEEEAVGEEKGGEPPSEEAVAVEEPAEDVEEDELGDLEDLLELGGEEAAEEEVAEETVEEAMEEDLAGDAVEEEDAVAEAAGDIDEDVMGDLEGLLEIGGEEAEEEEVAEEAVEEAMEEETAEEAVEEAAGEGELGDLEDLLGEEDLGDLPGEEEEPPAEAVEVEEEPEEAVAEEAPAEAEEPEIAEEIPEEAPGAEEAPAEIEDLISEDALDELMVREPPAEIPDEAAGEPGELAEEEPPGERIEELGEIPGLMEEAPEPEEAKAAEPEKEKVEEKPLTPEQLQIRQMAIREQLRRKAMDQHGMESLEAARKAVEHRRYEHAKKLYQEAMPYLVRPERAQERKAAEDGLTEVFYRLALSLGRQGKWKEALEAAEKAVSGGHAEAERVAAKLKFRIEHPPPKVKPEELPRWERDEYTGKEERAAELLGKARQRLMTEEYDKARSLLEGVLALDPGNTEAIRLLHKLALKKYDRATMHLESTREEMMESVRDTWLPRDYVPVKKSAEMRAGATEARTAVEKSDRIRILDKMQHIKIPEIDFRQGNINDVVIFLQEQSVEFDPTPIEEAGDQRGVNIVLNLGAGGRKAAPAGGGGAGGGFLGEGEGGGGAGGEAQAKLITFRARHISLFEALEIVTEMANMKYRIQGSVVMIVPSDAPGGKILLRMYDVMPGIEQTLPQLGQELARQGGVGGGGGGGFAPFGGGGGGEAEGEGSRWKTFFQEMGVEWPQGSSIKYVRTLGKLVVANTAANLMVFEKILGDINVVPTQIEIEARFVEITRNDASSIGLEWLLTDDWELAQDKGQPNVPVTHKKRLVMESNSGSGGFTRGNRYMSQGVGGTAIADGVMTLATKLTNPELTLVLHALERSGHADMLSAPKVTTKAGQPATIKVVTEYIYPTDFTVTPISGADAAGNTTIVGGVVEPSNFETREVGVILRVTPTLSAEGKMINLEMSPEVVSEPTWKNYGSTYTAPDGSVQQLTMEQPFFHARSVATSIMIYNGATVVMGGMINELRQDAHDKVPLLGSIPLLGRLFRSDYEISDKRNLLIFVTARQVTPEGRPVEESHEEIVKRIMKSTEEAAGGSGTSSGRGEAGGGGGGEPQSLFGL